ncbi:hypothetical protein F5Y16DRAFT_416551 [Xylariaceae sp. FL0255]|nr:hypothetical protein F5Y16DRAFT_416551 [Xylariaceae sp. FL0255]
MSAFLQNFDPNKCVSEFSEDEQKEIKEFMRMGQVIGGKSAYARSNMTVSPRQLRRDWRRNESPLLYLMNITSERKCYDPRDKAFALSGMVPDIQKVYPSDYNKPFATVVLETTAYMVNHERGPVMWAFLGLRDTRLVDDSYPSWVPDFDQADQETKNRHCSTEDDGEFLSLFDNKKKLHRRKSHWT